MHCEYLARPLSVPFGVYCSSCRMKNSQSQDRLQSLRTRMAMVIARASQVQRLWASRMWPSSNCDHGVTRFCG